MDAHPSAITNKMKEKLSSLLSFSAEKVAILVGFFVPYLLLIIFFLGSLLLLEGETWLASYLSSMAVVIFIVSLNFERYTKLVKGARGKSFVVKKVPHLAKGGRVYRVDRLVFSLRLYLMWLVGGFIFYLGLPALLFLMTISPGGFNTVENLQAHLHVSGWIWLFVQLTITGSGTFFLIKLFKSSPFWVKFSKGVELGLWFLFLSTFYFPARSIFQGGIY